MKKALTVLIDSNLIEQMRDIVYWTPSLSLNQLCEQAIICELERLKKEEPTRARDSKLKVGRKVTRKE